MHMSFRVFDRVLIESTQYPIGAFGVMNIAGNINGVQQLDINGTWVKTDDPNITIMLLRTAK